MKGSKSKKMRKIYSIQMWFARKNEGQHYIKTLNLRFHKNEMCLRVLLYCNEDTENSRQIKSINIIVKLKQKLQTQTKIVWEGQGLLICEKF